MFPSRARALAISLLIVAFAFIGRLFYIQLIDDRYKEFAKDNALRKEVVFPSRGLILDRNGKVLVQNELLYDVMVTVGTLKQFDSAHFSSLLQINPQELRDAFTKLKSTVGFVKYKAFPLIKGVSEAQYGQLQERLYLFTGMYVQSRSARVYPQQAAVHVLGYLGEVNDKNLKDDNYYRMGDFMGKNGMELQYEDTLRGTKGVRHVLVDVLNRVQGRYADGKYDKGAIAGTSIITGIDLDLQAYAEKLMSGKRGSMVAIEPSTGEVLLMVSVPTYNPNLLLGRERSANYAKLLTDPQKPMYNRAISAKYPPGSTLKPLEALLALQSGVIKPTTTFTCAGGYRLSASQTIGCHAAGVFDLHNSIRLSCNAYYCHVFKELVDDKRYDSVSAGLIGWAEGLNRFGAGKRTGIDVPNEGKGTLPSPKLYNKFYGPKRWHSSTIISLAIGQAEIGLTCLQLANAASAIANRGYYITPHFAKALDLPTGKVSIPWQRVETGIDTSYFSVIVNAMNAVVDHGTALWAKTPGLAICGKTGTSQNPHGEDHSIFIGFAPKDNPKIAIACIIENAGFGGSWAAPAASLIIEKYLNDSMARPWVENKILMASYQNKTSADSIKNSKHASERD